MWWKEKKSDKWTEGSTPRETHVLGQALDQHVQRSRVQWPSRIGLDHAVVGDGLADLVDIGQLRLLDKVIKESVVPRLNVVNGLADGDVQHFTLTQQIVESELDQAGGLTDAGAGHDHTQIASTEAAM